MVAGGWFKIHRALVHHELWLSETFTRGQAWVDLIMLANHKEGFIRRRGIRITVKRGQVGYSYDELARRWRWSKGKVIRFVQELKKDERISFETELKNVAVTTLITITNYEQYQGSGNENDTVNGNVNGPKIELKTVLEQEKKKEEEVESLPRQELGRGSGAKDFYLTKKKRKLTGKRLEAFKQFWTIFNYKHAKAEAADAWLDIPMLTDQIVSDILTAAEAEAKRRPSLIDRGRSPIYPQGWLSGRRWEDEAYHHQHDPAREKASLEYIKKLEELMP